MISWDCLSRRTITKTRRGRCLDLGFDSHKRMAGLSGSSKPTYCKVMFSFEPGYNLWTMFLTRVNSKGVRGSRGWGRWLETSEKMYRDRSKKSIGKTTILVSQVYPVCTIGSSSLKHVQLVPQVFKMSNMSPFTNCH